MTPSARLAVMTVKDLHDHVNKVSSRRHRIDVIMLAGGRREATARDRNGLTGNKPLTDTSASVDAGSRHGHRYSSEADAKMMVSTSAW
jgi:hypothetical protein